MGDFIKGLFNKYSMNDNYIVYKYLGILYIILPINLGKILYYLPNNLDKY